MYSTKTSYLEQIKDYYKKCKLFSSQISSQANDKNMQNLYTNLKNVKDLYNQVSEFIKITNDNKISEKDQINIAKYLIDIKNTCEDIKNKIMNEIEDKNVLLEKNTNKYLNNTKTKKESELIISEKEV